MTERITASELRQLAAAISENARRQGIERLATVSTAVINRSHARSVGFVAAPLGREA